jgi:hypothetical protein
VNGCSEGKSDAHDRLVSPDKRMTVVSRHGPAGEVYWNIAKGDKLLELDAGDWPCPEFLWAPDSSAVTMTYSDGGAIGNYHVAVYQPANYLRQGIDVTADAMKDFLAHYPKCYDPEDPNLAAVAWLPSTGHLLIAAEVLPHSNCDDMGTFALYEVTVPTGKIVRKYGQLEAKRRFGKKLGPELMNADDECFKKPGSCQIPDLHKKN